MAGTEIRIGEKFTVAPGTQFIPRQQTGGGYDVELLTPDGKHARLEVPNDAAKAMLVPWSEPGTRTDERVGAHERL